MCGVECLPPPVAQAVRAVATWPLSITLFTKKTCTEGFMHTRPSCKLDVPKIAVTANCLYQTAARQRSRPVSTGNVAR